MVVAIIALLLAILAPTSTMIIRFTYRTTCQSNLHHIGLGMQQYVADYKHYPGHCSALRHNYPYAIWPPRIRRYASERGAVMYCPERPDAFKWPKILTSTTGGAYATEQDAAEWFYEVGEKMLNVHNTPFSYAYNDWGNHHAETPPRPQRGLGGDIRSICNFPELPAAGVVNPSDMIAIGDSQQTGSWDFNLDPGNPWEYPAKVHDDGANIVFCDGHVEWGLQSYWIVPNHDTTTAEAKKMAKRWNNHNKWTND